MIVAYTSEVLNLLEVIMPYDDATVPFFAFNLRIVGIVSSYVYRDYTIFYGCNRLCLALDERVVTYYGA